MYKGWKNAIFGVKKGCKNAIFRAKKDGKMQFIRWLALKYAIIKTVMNGVIQKN